MSDHEHHRPFVTVPPVECVRDLVRHIMGGTLLDPNERDCVLHDVDAIWGFAAYALNGFQDSLQPKTGAQEIPDIDSISEAFIELSGACEEKGLLSPDLQAIGAGIGGNFRAWLEIILMIIELLRNQDS